MNFNPGKKEKLFNQILAENRHAFWRICCSWFKEHDLREDLFQDIVSEIWSSMERFKERSSWSTFVYRIALNTAIKSKMKLKKRKLKEVSLSESVMEPVFEDSTHQKLKTENQIEKMYSCMQKLPDSDRMLLSLVLEDLSYREIAVILDTNVNATGVRINRSKKRLMQKMEEQG